MYSKIPLHESVKLTSIEGGSANPKYNLSYIVEQSVEIGKPMIALSSELGCYDSLNRIANIEPQ